MDVDVRKLTITDWPEQDRPREKMLKYGKQILSDAELLAILIGSGNRDENAVELSRRILAECKNNLNELGTLSIHELCKRFKGIGEAKAITILAALEFANRRKSAQAMEKKSIKSSEDFFELFEPLLSDLAHEEFWIALLNGAHKVIEIRKLTQGGSRQTVVDVPMLLKLVLEKSAQAFAVAHNHPSGRTTPSPEDDNITRRIKQGADAIGVSLLDHIIVAQSSYFSFADDGRL